MNFASDNAAPAHPKVLESLAEANKGYALPYGSDPLTQSVTQMIRDVFEAPNAAVYLVDTGSAANVLSLAPLTAPWQTIYCHKMAHINVDECGAPEFYTGGAKLTLIDGADAKITPEALSAAITETPQGDVHAVQRGPVSITNVTECGAVYSPAGVRALADICRTHDLPLHMDGARFANAIAASGCSPADMTWRAGVDVLSFGGTKNGLIGVEAVVFFDPAPAWEFELRRKRAGHLLSKHRYLAAQMKAYLTGGLWLEMASRANAMAALLEREIAQVTGTKLAHSRDANMLFPLMPRKLHRAAQDAGWVYAIWPHDVSMEGEDDEVLLSRLVCNWSTTEAEIDAFVSVLKEI